jgi:hypothetical protein
MEQVLKLGYASFHFRSNSFRSVRQVAKSAHLSLRHACLSVCVSAVRPQVINSAPTGRIFVKFDVGDFYQQTSRKSRCG